MLPLMIFVACTAREPFPGASEIVKSHNFYQLDELPDQAKLDFYIYYRAKAGKPGIHTLTLEELLTKQGTFNDWLLIQFGQDETANIDREILYLLLTAIRNGWDSKRPEELRRRLCEARRIRYSRRYDPYFERSALDLSRMQNWFGRKDGVMPCDES